MLHSSLLEKEDGDLDTGPDCRCQMSPHVVRTIQRGVSAFNKSRPVSFLCRPVTGEMLDPLRHTDDTQHSLTEVKWLHTHFFSRQTRSNNHVYRSHDLSFHGKLKLKVPRIHAKALYLFIYLFMYLNSYERDNLTVQRGSQPPGLDPFRGHRINPRGQT